MATLRFGDYSVDAVSDGCLYFDASSCFPTVPADELRHACAEHGHGPGDKFGCFLTSYLIRGAGRTILVDTGMGPLPRPGAVVGLLPGALAEAGVPLESIDTVLFTHLHIDHVGWNLSEEDGESQPTFPNARYVVNRKEWESWIDVENDVVARSVRPLAGTGQLDLVDDGHEPAPGIRLLATPGHTPGHVGILIYGADASGIIAGDIAHHAMEWEHPEWSPRFDKDPVLSAKSRTALVERAEAEGLVLLGGHLPPPHAGKIVRVEQRRIYQPLAG